MLVDCIRPYFEAIVKALRISRGDDFSNRSSGDSRSGTSQAVMLEDVSKSNIFVDLEVYEVMKELATEKRRKEKEKRSGNDGRDVLWFTKGC
jgi:hypothetical protein